MSTYLQFPPALPGKSYMLTGRLLFYTRKCTHPLDYPSLATLTAVRRGPIFSTDTHLPTRIYATSFSSIGLKFGESLVERVHITVFSDGTITLQLRSSGFWVVANDSRLYVARHDWPQEMDIKKGARFKVGMWEGRQVLADMDGNRWHCWGEAGWNTMGMGDPLWCLFVKDGEKGGEYEFVWEGGVGAALPEKTMQRRLGEGISMER